MISEFDAVISCLPYNFNIGLAAAAHESGIHYFDLTEDVKTTKAIIQMSDTSRAVMAPQCGLAPGFILEAFTTSGGLGTMCDTYLGRVQNLDYKTIR